MLILDPCLISFLRAVVKQWVGTHKLALRGDLGESSAISLSNSNKLAALLASPAPCGGSLASGGTQVGVALEVIEVDL